MKFNIVRKRLQKTNRGYLNMELNGMKKLRLTITILFLLAALLTISTIIAGSINMNNEQQFLEELTWEDYDTLNDIYNRYPTKGMVVPDIVYSMLGWLLYIITGLLFFLMVKVWKVQAIY